MLRLLPRISFLLILLLGCTKAPEIPSLNRHSQEEKPPIVFGDKLEPKDYKNIFKAINKDHKLDSLNSFILEPTDEELQEIGDLISKYVYDEAQISRGLPSLIRKRFDKKDFSKLEKNSQEWVKAKDYPDKANALITAGKSILFPELVVTDLEVFLPPFTSHLNDVWKTANREYKEKYTWKYDKAILPSEVYSTFHKVLQDSRLTERVALLLGEWRDNEFLSNLLKGFYYDYREHKVEAYEGFVHKLSELLPNERNPVNRVEKLTRLVQLLDAPSDGLFSEVQRGLEEVPAQLHFLVDYLRFLDADAAAGYVDRHITQMPKTEPFWKKSFWEAIPKRDSTTGAPSAEFKDFFELTIRSMERVAGPLKDESNNSFYAVNLPIYLNSYAFTKWVEAVLSEAMQTEKWKKLREDEFYSVLKEFQVATPGVRIDTRSEATKKDFEALLINTAPRFLATFEKLKNQFGLGKATYEFAPLDSNRFLKQWDLVFREIDNARPIIISPSMLRTLSFWATRDGKENFQIADLETTNVLTSLNSLLATFPFPLWIKFENILFNQLSVGALPDNVRAAVLDFYANKPELKARVSEVFDIIQVFHELHTPVQELPLPITLYHSLLKLIAPTQLDTLGKSLRLMADHKFFSLDPDTKKPLYPTFYQILEKGSGLGEFMVGVSLLGVNSKLQLTTEIVSTITVDKQGSGITKHISLLRELFQKHPQGITEWISDFMNHGQKWVEDLSTLPKDEAFWARTMVENRDHRRLWNYFTKYGSLKKAHQLTRELIVLEKKGFLKEAFMLLGNLKNERLKTLSTFLLDWQSSGEMMQLLTAAERLLAPVVN